jgi:hypothetical protein
MRILSDIGTFTALSRPQDASQRSAPASQAPFNSSKEPASSTILPQTQSVSAAGNTPTDSKAKRDSLRDDARAFAREAPNGQRPKFVPKGQSLDISV